MKYSIEQSTLTAIGDSIRAKSGLTEAISPLDMPNAIDSISSGGESDDLLKGLIERSLTEIIIPLGITRIGSYLFYSSSLTSITIPNSVTTIGGSAFYGCNRLRKITIPNSVTTIDSYAFQYCTRLESIAMPNGIAHINDSVFYYCSSLTSITIPNSVTSVGRYAFYGCNLREIHLKPTTPPTLSDTNAFNGISSRCIMYVPKGCLEAYQSATNWSSYASYMMEEE